MSTEKLEKLSQLSLEMEELCSDIRLETNIDIGDIETSVQTTTMDIQTLLDEVNGVSNDYGE